MSSNPLRSRRILVVEDEYFLAMEMLREFVEEGASVIGPAPSVKQALALIASEPNIAAAVLDINLGGEQAFPIADALIARGVPIVFTTGYAEGDLDRAYAGVPRCLKPVEFSALKEVLAAEIHSRPPDQR